MNENRKTPIAEGDSEIDLLAVAKVLLRKFYWLLLAGIVAGAAVYLIVTLLVTPTYESSVSFYVYNNSKNNSQIETINNSDLEAAENLATTYSEILTSSSVLDVVSENVKDNISRKELGNMVEASVVSNTQLINVVVTTTDPKLSYRIANSFANVVPTEMVRITKAGGVEVVNRPEVATEKASPSVMKDTAIGFLAGVVLAAVILVLRMSSDTTIYLSDDIERLTEVPVLGQVPDINVADENQESWTLTKGGTVSYDTKA